MELTLNRGVLGQYDAGSSLRYKGKEKYVDKFFEYIAGAIAIIAAVVLFFSCLGACMGCKSVMSCYDGCSCSCAKNIVQACYDAGEACRTSSGCKPSSSSSGCSSSGCGPSTTTNTTTYKAINNVTGTYDYWYVRTYKYGCKNTGSTTDTEFALDTTYWNLEGIYTDASLNKQIKFENMKENKIYYTKWTEIKYGEDVDITFTVSNNAKQYAHLLPTIDPAIVGSDSVDWDDILDNIPDLDNYEFKGIYLNGEMIVDEYKKLVSSKYDGEFHLYNWGANPGQTIKLEIRYEGLPITITIWDLDTESILYQGTDFGYGTSAYEVIFYNDYSQALNTFLNNREVDEVTISGTKYTSRQELIELNINGPQNIYLKSHRKYFEFAVYVGDENNGYESLYYSNAVEYNKTYGDVINNGKNFPSWFTTDYVVIGYSTESSSATSYSLYSEIKDIKVTDDVELYVVYRKKNYSFSVYRDYSNRLFSVTVPYNSLWSDVIEGNMPLSFTNQYYILGYAETYGETDLTKIYSIESLQLKPVEDDVKLYVIVAETQTIYFVVGTKWYYQDLPKVTNYALPDIDDSYKVPGFAFDGWYTDSEFQSVRISTMTQVMNNNIDILYAKLIGETYTISFYDGIDQKIPKNHEQYTSSSNPYLLKDGSDLITIPAGYTFMGWKLKGDTTNTKITQIDAYDYGNKDLEAILKPLRFTMFISVPVGGSISLSNSKQTHDYDSIPELPTPSVNTGFEFKGYYYNDGSSELKQLTDKDGVFLGKYNQTMFGMNYTQFKTYLEDSGYMIDIVAKIELQEFNVELKSNNTTLSNQTVKYGNYAKYSQDIVVPHGYQFKGWNEDQNATTGKELSKIAITKDTTLYAIFTLCPITITYADSADNKLNLIPASSTVDYGTLKGNSVLSVPSDSSYYYHPDYEFEGWYLGTKKVSNNLGELEFDFNEGNLGVDYNTLITTGITLEAQSKKREFTVKFFMGNEQIGEDVIVEYNGTITKPADPTVPVGYSFQYWKLNNSSSEYNFSSKVTSNITLNAYYTANKYLVTLEVESFEDSSLVTINNKTTETVLLTYDEEFTLPKPTYSGVKYDFDGYCYGITPFTDVNCNGKFKFNMTNLSVLGIGIADLGEPGQPGGLTLEATYKIKTFNIEYYANGNLFDTVTVDYGAQAAKPANTPTANNKRFVGWSTVKNPTTASPLYNFTGSQVTSNMKLYAVFSNKVTVRLLDIDGISLLGEIVLDYGSNLTSIESMYYTNWGITQWNTLNGNVLVALWDSDSGTYWINESTVTRNITDDLVLVVKTKNNS